MNTATAKLIFKILDLDTDWLEHLYEQFGREMSDENRKNLLERIKANKEVMKEMWEQI